jgi:hypothetical protein
MTRSAASERCYSRQLMPRLLLAFGLMITAAGKLAAQTPEAPLRCIVDDKLLFERAVERVWEVITRDRKTLPKDNTFDGLLPSFLMGKFLANHGSPKNFVEKHPDCCFTMQSNIPPFDEVLNADWSGPPYYNKFPISKQSTIVVRVKIRARIEAEGRAGWFRQEHEVLLGKCGERLNIGKFDLSTLGTQKESEEVRP